MDIVFLYKTSTHEEQNTIIQYCKNADRCDYVVRGLKNILAFDFNKAEIELRLSHVTIPNYDSFVYLAKNVYTDLISALS